MPKRDGLDFIASVRALDDDALRRVPVAAFTAFARPDDRARILAAGYQARLVKPIEPARLVETLEDLASVQLAKQAECVDAMMRRCEDAFDRAWCGRQHAAHMAPHH